METSLLNFDKSGVRNNKPTIVFVHGVAGSLHIWDPIFDALSQETTVFRFDLLGYGRSPKPRIDYTPEAHVRAIRRTLRAQGVKPPYALVGLSMGVTIVLTFAALFPQETDSVTGIGYPYYPDKAAAETGLRNNLWAGLTIKHPFMASIIIPPIWGLSRIGIIPPRLFTKIYSPLMAHDTMRNPYRVFRSNIFNSMVNVDADGLLQRTVDMKRLFIHGEQDAWAPVDVVRTAVVAGTHTTFVSVSDAEHNLVVLKPEQTTALIINFLHS